jgi:hypothetical protein
MTHEPDAPRIADEMRTMQAEPFLPIETKLIVGSLVLGAVLLAVLLWISNTFFPVPR